jgi:hypothetical protein
MPIPIQAARQRISDFVEHVNLHQADVRTLGNEAWANTPSTGEVEIIRQFLSRRDCGTAFLNETLTPILSTSGWVVKFASIFLHQMPMVRGWKDLGASRVGTKKLLSQRCELGDLQTLFVYLTADKIVCQMRSVIFQAKLRPESGAHVIDHPFQRALYDECEGFRYETVLSGKDRRLPVGPNRERALQYLFVSEKPARARTIPANAGLGAFVDYGEHLLRFLNDATGLEVLPRSDDSMGWSRIVWDMIGEVAQEVTSQAMPRNEGLKAVLDYFNSFESHETFYVGPDQAGDGGFGVQLVLAWDSQLDGFGAAHAMIPKHLLSLAHEYDTTHIADYRERIRMKDDWVKEMAWLLKQGVSRTAVADVAKSLKSNGLIAALGELVLEAPESGDEQLLIDLLPYVSWKHAITRLLSALTKLAESGRLSADQMENVMRLVHEHPLACEPDVESRVKDLVHVIQTQLSNGTDDPQQSIDPWE